MVWVGRVQDAEAVRECVGVGDRDCDAVPDDALREGDPDGLREPVRDAVRDARPDRDPDDVQLLEGRRERVWDRDAAVRLRETVRD
mmetsp:Transcript_81671/g.144073  ORF Transcript_81671/g.144073 Transcript_81671/m.144073 type:complete len:86 (-) Transcript_81671:734-991(-)